MHYGGYVVRAAGGWGGLEAVLPAFGRASAKAGALFAFRESAPRALWSLWAFTREGRGAGMIGYSSPEIFFHRLRRLSQIVADKP